VFALDLMSTYEGEHTIFGLLIRQRMLSDLSNYHTDSAKRNDICYAYAMARKTSAISLKPHSSELCDSSVGERNLFYSYQDCT
jgi:hypothetical protein